MRHAAEPDIVKRVDDIRTKVARVKELISRNVFSAKIPLSSLSLLTFCRVATHSSDRRAGASQDLSCRCARRSTRASCKAHPVYARPHAVPYCRHGSARRKGEVAVFRFIEGPVFAQLLMADEINRASPKTQSALLQAMQEQQINFAGQTYALPSPFFVLATRTRSSRKAPIPCPKRSSTFPLAVRCDLPGRRSERRMLYSTTGLEDRTVKQFLDADEVMAASASCGSFRRATASSMRSSNLFAPRVLKLLKPLRA